MIMSICFGTNVSAFYWTRYRWSSSSIQYYYDNWIGSKARIALYNGASAWRATNADATINESPSSSRVYCYVLNDPTGDWDGVTECVMDPSTHYFVSQELILNTVLQNHGIMIRRCSQLLFMKWDMFLFR